MLLYSAYLRQNWLYQGVFTAYQIAINFEGQLVKIVLGFTVPLSIIQLADALSMRVHTLNERQRPFAHSSLKRMSKLRLLQTVYN